MKKKLFKTRLLSFAAFCGLTFAFVSCANEDVAQNPNSTDNDKNLTTFSTGNPLTRTSMESDGKFFWEPGDKIYVEDDNGVWQKSSNTPTAKTASFKFKVPGKFSTGSTYKVYYPGQNNISYYGNTVYIQPAQSQSEPNTTAHFGASGDCGMADAVWSNTKNGFEFSLDHKAAYLLLLPHTSNTVVHKCYLTRLEVHSDNDISGVFSLDPTTGKLVGESYYNYIYVSIGGSGAYANGFPLTNTAQSAATNGTYVIIKPGTHTLKIRYWVKEIATGTEGTITKTLASATYDQNKYYKITANLNVKDYDGDHYYMWDAHDQYWKGHEWNHGGSQPTLNHDLPNATTSSDYAQSNTDLRYYHKGSGSPFNATQSCATLPNVNEMTWYAAKGDPRWDADELWTTMDHLYKGGMWFKKKAYINGYKNDTAVDGTDWQTTGKQQTWPVSPSLPSAADAGKYFYLPALGCYRSGQLYSIGNTGNTGNTGDYWSSSAEPRNSLNAFSLNFDSDHVYVHINDRNNGFRVGVFE